VSTAAPKEDTGNNMPVLWFLLVVGLLMVAAGIVVVVSKVLNGRRLQEARAARQLPATETPNTAEDSVAARAPTQEHDANTFDEV
jgi:hypothetical protein